MGQIAQDAWVRGWGCEGQPNLGNACILGVSVPETPPLAKSFSSSIINCRCSFKKHDTNKLLLPQWLCFLFFGTSTNGPSGFQW